MEELFRQVIQTKSGIFEKQTVRTFILIYILCVAILLFLFFIMAKYLSWVWFFPAIGFWTIIFLFIFEFKYRTTPKKLELLITNEKLHVYNCLGFKKGYFDLSWNDIVEIRIIGDAENISIDSERSVIDAYKNRIIAFAAVTNNSIYVFEVDSENLKKILETIKKVGKYNPNLMNWDEVWQKKGVLFSFK